MWFSGFRAAHPRKRQRVTTSDPMKEKKEGMEPMSGVEPLTY
jgi:hypothetical protein